MATRNSLIRWWNGNSDTVKKWAKAIGLFALELLLVYALSNLPLLLLVFTKPMNVAQVDMGFFDKLTYIVNSEFYKGQLLSFTCSLIAPVMFWAVLEVKKSWQSRLLLLVSFFILLIPIFIHDRPLQTDYFTYMDIYLAALAVWALSVLFRIFPPEPDITSPNQAAARINSALGGNRRGNP
ncbi:MAG: hypothetical protein PSY14_15930 [bacterium]|nr:hypothetical protein [bacterium]